MPAQVQLLLLAMKTGVGGSRQAGPEALGNEHSSIGKHSMANFNVFILTNSPLTYQMHQLHMNKLHRHKTLRSDRDPPKTVQEVNRARLCIEYSSQCEGTSRADRPVILGYLEQTVPQHPAVIAAETLKAGKAPRLTQCTVFSATELQNLML